MSLTITPTFEQVQIIQNRNNVIQVSAQGPVGPGVPNGGVAGQYLRKQSAADQDTAWANIAIGEVTGLSVALVALQPLNSSLTQISGLTFAANDLIQYVGGVLTNRTPTQVKASLAIATGDVSGLGTIATQNANAVAITGGTMSGVAITTGSINNTPIGATTATTGAFTTVATTGNIGAGKASPARRLDVIGAAASLFRLERDTNSAQFIELRVGDYGAGNGAILYAPNLAYSVNGSNALVHLGGNGRVGIGTVAPSSLLHTVLTDTGTNDTQNVLTIGRNSSNTPAANFASSVVFQLKTSTTNDQNAASIVTSLVVATHASYTTRQVHNIYDAGGAREAFRIEASGSAPMIGFLGAAAVIRQALGAWAGLTDAQRITALRDALTNLGLTSYT